MPDAPTHSTAPQSSSPWLLVEHAGPWPATGLADVLPHPAAELTRRAMALGIRLQLIRRPLPIWDESPHQVFIVQPRGESNAGWVERRVLCDLRQLDALDLSTLASRRRPKFGQLWFQPLILTCTHGSRHKCCAQIGRPVAHALGPEFGHLSWETTHVGGDQFAPNLVCLPEGIYYGEVSAQEATEIGSACLRNEIHLPKFRGRTGLKAPVQAAEAIVRQLTGVTQYQSVQIANYVDNGHATTVGLTVLGRRLRATVLADRPSCPQLSTCCPARASTCMRHRLIQIESIL
jgi:hypothetical protein